MLLGGALMSTIGAKLIRNNMRVVAFGITLVGVSVVGLGVVHNLLAYLLIDVVNGLASAICMGPMRTIIQTEADEKMVGRVFGLDTTMSTQHAAGYVDLRAVGRRDPDFAGVHHRRCADSAHRHLSVRPGAPQHQCTGDSDTSLTVA